MALAGPASARDPMLSLPLDCTLGDTCFIQNYVDADPGDGAADFTCQGLSYNTHKGTDFALIDMASMEAGVTVRPAAPGVVKALRDEMPDTGAAPDLPRNRYCGNGVLLDHGGGWETQYCHMKRGSIAVTTGQRVGLDTVLGEVGYSGHTQFPHLHIAVRKDGAVVDPFNTDDISTCGRDDGPQDDLWAETIPYRAGGLVSTGVASAVPAFEQVKAGRAHLATLNSSAPALVGFAQVFGGRAGDVVEVSLIQPNGQAFHTGRATLEKSQARLFRAFGKKRPQAGWETGEWAVQSRLMRGGAVLETQRTAFEITP